MMKGEEMKEIKIGMLGFGTVGTGVVRVLRENEREITAKAGVKLTLKSVLVRDAKKERPYMEGLHLTENVDEILNDEEIDIVIELLGGIHPAREYMLVAMEKGKNVVTANKDVVAQFGKDMFEAMEKYGVDFHFEASVGGGIPIVMPLKQCLTANRVTEIMGIINGTTNYMLSQMAENGSDYDSVLKEAQAKGYAEANPAADVEGLDAARKIAILASIAFNTRIRFEDVSVEGITKVTPEDIEYAKALGYVVKLLAIGRDCGEAVSMCACIPYSCRRRIRSPPSTTSTTRSSCAATPSARRCSTDAVQALCRRLQPSSLMSSTSRATCSSIRSGDCTARAMRTNRFAPWRKRKRPTMCAFLSMMSRAFSLPSRRHSATTRSV